MKLIRYSLFLMTTADALDKWTECCGEQSELKTCQIAPCGSGTCQDCVFEEWGDFGPCGCFGLQDRFRDIKVPSNHCGKPCNGSKVDTKACLPHCMKQEKRENCELTAWTPWTECSKSCDVGQQYRERTIKTDLLSNGLPCDDDTKQTRPCNTIGCHNPHDCELTDFGAWSACSKSCNGGQQERKREVKVPAKNYGLLCNDTLSEIRGCSENACAGALNCQWDEWITWSSCSASCGGGQKSRSRLIVVAPRNGGKLCEANDMSEIAPCGTNPCNVAVDCKIGEWQGWSACTCDCNGAKSRTRRIETFPSNGGKGCDGSLKEVDSCNVGPEHCEEKVKVTPPIDCELTPYSAWSKCTVSCGGGTQERSREIRVDPEYNGKACDRVLSQIKACNEDACPVEVNPSKPIDCAWGTWGDWNECTVKCGGGARQRNRDIISCANKYGKPCDAESAVEMEGCNLAACGSKDCVWGDWGDWGACSCTGLQERHRNIATHSSEGGTVCVGPKVITQSCHSHCTEPPIDCALSKWAGWSRCSAECGGGEQFRTRHIASHEARGGKPCDGFLKEIQPCHTKTCSHPVDCHIAEWSDFSKCSAECDGGQQFRHREIMTFASYGGKACTDELKEVRGCNTNKCGGVQDCKWGGWTDWSACTKTCGGGQRGRDRTISIAPRKSGKLCDALTKAEIAPCNTQDCSGGCVDGEWDEWEDFGLCSASCGVGYQSRSRGIKTKPNYCGKGLEGNLTQFVQCNSHPCGSEAVDCDIGVWSSWGACSCSCNGIRARSRHIVEYSHNGGIPCTGGVKEVGGCNEGKCGNHEPEDCEFGEWKPWTKCTAACGGGIQKRIRYIAAEPNHSGKPCKGSLQIVQGCNFHTCVHATDCLWGQWAEWDTCSAPCGGGQKTRYRHISQMPNSNGKPCKPQDNVEILGCNTEPCGEMMYCAWAQWSGWSSCSRECGSGEITRTRELVKSATRPEDGVLDTGILAQLHSALEDDTKLQFSFEDAATVFLLAMVIAGFSLAAGMRAFGWRGQSQ